MWLSGLKKRNQMFYCFKAVLFLKGGTLSALVTKAVAQQQRETAEM